MASTRKGTAQPFKKGARTLSAALSAATKGAGAMANPQDPDRELQKNAGGMTKPMSSADQIRLIQRQRTAVRLQDALKSRATGGSAAMPGPPKGLTPGSGGNPGGASAPDPEGGRRVVNDTSSSAPRSGPKPAKSGRLASALSAPAQKTYVSKGEINQTGNARSGQDFATFTVDGKPGEYHEYVNPDGTKRVVRVGGKKPRSSRTGPAKGLARALSS